MARPRTPAQHLKLSGSRHAKGRSDEPILPPNAEEPPEFLGPDAAEEWARIVPLLEKHHLVNRQDHAVLVTYCTAWGDFVSLRRQVNDEGHVVTGEKGEIINPAFRAMKMAAELMNQAGARLGLSVMDRTKIKLEPPEKEEKKGMARFVEGA